MIYRYNPECRCDWCANHGTIPAATPDNGHSFGYEEPHQPPNTTTRTDDLHRPITAVIDLHFRLKRARVTVKAWHITQAEADRMDRLYGQHTTILGYPVLIDR